jgi:hypothetical protein
MTRGGEVAGRVTDSGRQRSVLVSAIRPFYEEGRRVLGSMSYGKSGIVSNVSTNNNGDYRISGLPPGQYYFCLNSNGQICAPAPVNLRAGDSLKGVNIEFRSTDQQVVQGEIVSRVSGRPINSARLGIVPIDAVPNPPSTPFRNSNSEFATALRFGTYFVLASAVENGVPVFGYTPIAVRGTNLPPVPVVVEPSFSISGQVSGNGSANSVVRLQALIPGMPDVSPVSVSNDGAFQLRGVSPGEYRVWVSNSRAPETYLQSIRLGGREVADAILQISTHVNGKLEISLGTNAAGVTGSVIRRSGNKGLAAAGMRVVLVPEVTRRGRRDLYKTAVSDKDGKFQLVGIAPGNYKIYAWELVEEGAWEDPEFMRIYEDAGRAIRVGGNGRESLDVNLIPPWN